MYWVYRTQIDDKENISGIAAHPKRLRCKMVLFTALLMTFLFEQVNNRLATNNLGTHPNSQTRLHDMIRTTATHLVEMDETVLEVFCEVLEEFTALAPVLSGLPTGDELLRACQDAALQTALDERGADLKAARPAFTDFGYR